jgi:hypothetical protein
MSFPRASSTMPLPSPSGDHQARGVSHPTDQGIVFPVSGITPSCREIMGIHRRVAHHDIPMPTRRWIRSQAVNAAIPLPDRRPGEPPIQQEQVLKIRSFSREIDGSRVISMGEDQADWFIEAMTRLRREHYCKILGEYYSGHGESVPKSAIDHALNYPGQGIRRPRYGSGWRAILFLLCTIWVLAKVLEAAHR